MSDDEATVSRVDIDEADETALIYAQYAKEYLDEGKDLLGALCLANSLLVQICGRMDRIESAIDGSEVEESRLQ